MCWLLLAFIQCNSVIRLQSAAARDAPRRRRGDPADAPPTGKRDPGAVTARSAPVGVGVECRCRARFYFFIYTRVFLTRGLSRERGGDLHPPACVP